MLNAGWGDLTSPGGGGGWEPDLNIEGDQIQKGKTLVKLTVLEFLLQLKTAQRNTEVASLKSSRELEYSLVKERTCGVIYVITFSLQALRW